MEMRTKQEVIQFLESKVGTKVKCVGNSSLDGMCVTLIKSLMEFLGVPDPYKARGHAKTAISAYLSEGIAKQGMGFISVFSNKDMGGGYGHIWCNAGDGNGEFYESNGVKALTVTKGKTYSYDMICNFDQYITDNTYRGYDLSNAESMRICVDDHIRVAEGQLIDKSQYESIKGQLTESQKRVEELSSELGTIRGELTAAIQKIDNQNQVISSYVNEDAVQIETLKRLERENGVILDDYLDLRDPIATELKVSIGSESRKDSNTKVLGALQSQIQMSISLQSKVSELEKEVKRLNTHKKPIEKLSTKSLIIYLLQRLIKRS